VSHDFSATYILHRFTDDASSKITQFQNKQMTETFTTIRNNFAGNVTLSMHAAVANR